MFGHQSMLSTFGWWVVWVYSLTIAAFMSLFPPEYRPPSALEVAFSGNGIVIDETDANGLLRLKATLNRPAPYAMDVPIMWTEVSAALGRDFRVEPAGAVMHFENGSVEGRMRTMKSRAPDITIVDNDEINGDGGSRSFRLSLQVTADATVGDDGLCTVTIVDDDKAEPKAEGVIPVSFAAERVEVPEGDLASTVVEVRASSALSSKTPVSFKLYRTSHGDERSFIKGFSRQFEVGCRSVNMRLDEILDSEEIRRLGLLDDSIPGDDEAYEIDMEIPRYPLFPENPRTCTLVAKNDDPATDEHLVFLDRDGRKIGHLEEDGSVLLARSGPMECDAEDVISIGGGGGVKVKTPAGSTQSEPVSVSSLGGIGGSIGSKVKVMSSPAEGSGKGGGKGCGCETLCGPPKAGNYIVILVNDERLHEPGNMITDRVREAVASHAAEMYDNGAIILNRKDKGEDILTPTGGSPDKDKMFRPFQNEEDEDVAGQLARIEDTIRRKREAAKNPEMRAIVIWPERNLFMGRGLRPPKGPGVAPVSFLLPDAHAAYAGYMHKGLVPDDAKPGEVTVRSPNESEFTTHLENVMRRANEEADERQGEEDQGGTSADEKSRGEADR